MKIKLLFVSISLFCFNCYTVHRTDKKVYNEAVNNCINQSVDSIIPSVENITELICEEFKLVVSDTLYIKKTLIKLFDSSKALEIQECFKKNHKTLVYLEKNKYPYIILQAKYDRCKYILKIGIIEGDLAGHGSTYEIIKTNNKYILGKAINLWIS
jgi:hypothetical protein